jgi:uncharacterized protein YcsI (UPF0317 family)
VATITRTLPNTPTEIRKIIRVGEYADVTSALAPGYVQANLVILPKEQAFDFLLFCQRNPKPCPLIEVMEPGVVEPKITSAGADIRSDLPKYRVFRDGEMVEEPTDISHLWRKDLETFLLGCSFTFEKAMVDAGIPLWHWDHAKNVAMWRTNIPCTPAGAFHGPTVVSMRPIHHKQIVRAVQVTSRFPNAHGAPLHIGNPEAIGIKDITKPDYGDEQPFKEGQVPVFWACGVTPQAVALQSKPPFMITHSPGHMFITNMRDADLAAL